MYKLKPHIFQLNNIKLALKKHIKLVRYDSIVIIVLVQNVRTCLPPSLYVLFVSVPKLQVATRMPLAENHRTRSCSSKNHCHLFSLDFYLDARSSRGLRKGKMHDLDQRTNIGQLTIEGMCLAAVCFLEHHLF